MGRALSCIVPALLVAAPAAASQSDLRIGGNVNRYESRYGAPENRSLDENPSAWPEGRAIRTVGYLSRQPQRQGRRVEDDRPRASPRIYSLHRRYSLALNPVPEIADLVEFHATSWLGREVEVVGAFADGTFLVWSMLVLEEREDDDGFDAPRSSLEDLVIDGEAARGRVVQVAGTFRGANLLEDLPDDSRRNDRDWVLQDGPFSIWVTGKEPEGDGFSLDLVSREDLRWELAVQGEVEVHDGFIYLRAERIRLVGRARDDAEAAPR